jgi:hypothetical protein
MPVLEWFCDVDDVLMSRAPKLNATRLGAGNQRQRPGPSWPREMMTMLIHCHQSHSRTFTASSTEHVQVSLTSVCPHVGSSARFIALIPSMLVPLFVCLQSHSAAYLGISLLDATSLNVCDPPRIYQHRVVAADTARGKSSMGWFVGFTFHLAVNNQGELGARLQHAAGSCR